MSEQTSMLALEPETAVEKETTEEALNKPRVHGWLWWLMVVVCMALLGFWLRLGWIVPDRWPLRWLEITSEQQRISDDQVRARLTDSVSSGFFSLNLTQMRNQLLELNWVADANLQRRWPDTLQIAIREHQPVAYWGDDYLLSDRRELFASENQIKIQGLPVLFGADERRDDVVDNWLYWREASAEKSLRITRLELHPRGSWQFEFDNEIVLRIGRDHLEQRMQRFLDIWPEISSRVPRPIVLDMRYSNGLTLSLPSISDVETNELAIASTVHTSTIQQTTRQGH